ncbi:MAG: hypothetical protein AAGE52_28090 [Myxococcota bacterium]
MKRTLTLALLVACGGGETETAEPVTPTTTGGETDVAVSDVMPLAPFALVFPDGRVSMDAEGNVTFEGESNAPTMHADGRVVVNGERGTARRWPPHGVRSTDRRRRRVRPGECQRQRTLL